MSERTRHILHLAKQNNMPTVIAVVEETDMYLSNISTTASVNEKSKYY